MEVRARIAELWAAGAPAWQIREEAEARIKQDQIAAQQRKAEMVKLADSFEAAVGEIVETVSSA